jgi:hypothetical protein
MFRRKNVLQEKPGMPSIFLGRSRYFVHFFQTIKPAHSADIYPMQPYQPDARRNHLISMAIERRMNKHIARSCAYPSEITGLFKAAGENDRGVSVEMPMTRQTEASGKSFDSRSHAAKLQYLRGRHTTILSRCGERSNKRNIKSVQYSLRNASASWRKAGKQIKASDHRP